MAVAASRGLSAARGGGTRIDIIEAARRLFSTLPYDKVGLRDIAADAGVDKRLITRYFGSKEELFVEVVEFAGRDMQRHPSDLDAGELSRHLISRIFSPSYPHALSDRERHEFIGLCINAATSAVTKGLLKDRIEAHIPAAIGVTGADTRLRTALLFANSIGLALCREVLEVDALVEAKPAEVEKYMSAYLQALLRG